MRDGSNHPVRFHCIVSVDSADLGPDDLAGRGEISGEIKSGADRAMTGYSESFPNS